MAKTFGEGIYSAYRQDGVLHVAASGLEPTLQTKVTLEQLPFLIFPPRLGLMFETAGITSPATHPYEIEKAFPSYPASTKVVAIADKNGLHAIDIVEKPPTVSPLIVADPAAPNFVVYQQIGTEHYLIAKADDFVPAIYARVFGPDSYAHCQAYIAPHTAAAPTLDLIANSFVARIERPHEQPWKFVVTIDAFIEVDWTATLTSASPQGINPLVKLLKFDIALPTGAAHSHAIAKRTFHYEENPTGQAYTNVTIENGAQSLSKVVETS